MLRMKLIKQAQNAWALSIHFQNETESLQFSRLSEEKCSNYQVIVPVTTDERMYWFYAGWENIFHTLRK